MKCFFRTEKRTWFHLSISNFAIDSWFSESILFLESTPKSYFPLGQLFPHEDSFEVVRMLPLRKAVCRLSWSRACECELRKRWRQRGSHQSTGLKYLMITSAQQPDVDIQEYPKPLKTSLFSAVFLSPSPSASGSSLELMKGMLHFSRRVSVLQKRIQFLFFCFFASEEIMNF